MIPFTNHITIPRFIASYCNKRGQYPFFRIKVNKQKRLEPFLSYDANNDRLLIANFLAKKVTAPFFLTPFLLFSKKGTDPFYSRSTDCQGMIFA
ncbi:MAG: hypothetical protein DRP93_05325 [Candidatus Neomarinimicrobiota bacterium]|nr:MAG: hypothetical protein DRP93_05325 [Candidatus Neomarinimicrobiota bacterium]